MAAPAQHSLPIAQALPSQSVVPQQNLTMEDMLRQCIELCAQVADQHDAPEIAQSIRKLKPASRWP